MTTRRISDALRHELAELIAISHGEPLTAIPEGSGRVRLVRDGADPVVIEDLWGILALARRGLVTIEPTGTGPITIRLSPLGAACHRFDIRWTAAEECDDFELDPAPPLTEASEADMRELTLSGTAPPAAA